jgi:hypothetical protein
MVTCHLVPGLAGSAVPKCLRRLGSGEASALL